MAVLEFGEIQPNLPHWASAKRAEGVRFSTVLDCGVKRWLTGLNAGCLPEGGFLGDAVPIPTRGDALSAFGAWSGAGMVWRRCKISDSGLVT